MSLYLHNIWIHWSDVFESTDFNLEGTDMYEAWLATAKRIMRYLTNRKQESALLELVTRVQMEDSVSSQTESADKSWRRIEHNFKGYEWKEYSISHSEILGAPREWDFFIEQLKTRGFSQLTGDYSWQNTTGEVRLCFNTLPLEG